MNKKPMEMIIMKFKIKKEASFFDTMYWTEPINFFAKLWYKYNPFVYLMNKQTAWDCWYSKEEAIQHIKRWNSGYYKKRYYSKYV